MTGARAVAALRPATAADEPFLRRLHGAVLSEELGLAGWEDSAGAALLDLQFEARRRDFAARFPAADDRIVLVDGQPVGRLWLCTSASELRVLDLALLPEARGSGVGTAVMSDVLAEAQGAGLVVRLSVAHGNLRAQRFYRRLGFTPDGDDDGVVQELQRPPAAGHRATR